jgi:predicted RNA polymerase sigma factor
VLPPALSPTSAEAGLARLAPLEADERLRGNHRLDAVRAHLLERAGNRVAAVSLYRAAAEQTTSLPERNYLMMCAARLGEENLVSVAGS